MGQKVGLMAGVALIGFFLVTAPDNAAAIVRHAYDSVGHIWHQLWVFVIESAGEAQGLRRITYVPTPDAIYLEISEVLFAQARHNPVSMMDTPPGGGPRVLGPDA